MALLGNGALAMWWNIAPEVRGDFADWHAHEHFPERLALPGFRRGTRWTSAGGDDGMFVLYEAERHETLWSPEYLARLNAPTPWSTRLMPHHRDMVRSLCRVVASHGGAIARHALTVRLAPAGASDDDEALARSLVAIAADVGARPAIFGAHVLRHRAPPIDPTREQAIRNHADRSAPWVFVACAWDDAPLAALATDELAPERLASVHGAAAGAAVDLYALACSAVAGELA